MTIDWSAKQWDLTPTAPEVGPFVRSGFLSAWWRAFGGADDHLQIVVDDTGLVPIWHTEDAIRLAGEGDLTDYHSPLGIDGAQMLVDFVLGRPGGSRYDFDSLPREAAESITAFFGYQGFDAAYRQHALALRVALPFSFDEYLLSIGKKQRHEIRRKTRRFAELVGEPILATGDAFEDLDFFFSTHRRAPGEKQHFMTDQREAFFRDL